jgi:hypothetical protein
VVLGQLPLVCQVSPVNNKDKPQSPASTASTVIEDGGESSSEPECEGDEDEYMEMDALNADSGAAEGTLPLSFL